MRGPGQPRADDQPARGLRVVGGGWPRRSRPPHAEGGPLPAPGRSRALRRLVAPEVLALAAACRPRVRRQARRPRADVAGGDPRADDRGGAPGTPGRAVEGRRPVRVRTRVGRSAGAASRRHPLRNRAGRIVSDRRAGPGRHSPHAPRDLLRRRRADRRRPGHLPGGPRQPAARPRHGGADDVVGHAGRAGRAADRQRAGRATRRRPRSSAPPRRRPGPGRDHSTSSPVSRCRPTAPICPGRSSSGASPGCH